MADQLREAVRRAGHDPLPPAQVDVLAARLTRLELLEARVAYVLQAGGPWEQRVLRGELDGLLGGRAARVVIDCGRRSPVDP